MTNHLKRYFAPKTWKIKRKCMKYITKPSPGTHKIGMSMPINVILRDILEYASTNKEVKFILSNKNILVDGKRRKDYRFPVGLFDVLSLSDIDEHFRVILNKKGKLAVIKIGKEESKTKLCKITGKKAVRKKIQLSMNDGKNTLVDKSEVKVGDSVLIALGDKITIKDSIKLDKNTSIYLTGGKHIGHTGKVQDIEGKRIIYKTEKGDVFETLKKYALAIGKDKPVISIAE